MVYGETYPFEVRIDITNLHAGDRIHIHTVTIEVPHFPVEYAIVAEFAQAGQAETFTLDFHATNEAKSGQMNLQINLYDLHFGRPGEWRENRIYR